MKAIISVPEILTAINGTEAGEALYNNKGGELCGFVCSENNVFTDIQEAKELLTDFMLNDCEMRTDGKFQEVYGDAGIFKGFTYTIMD